MSMARLLAIGMIALSTTGHGAWAQTPGNAAQPPRQQAPDAASRLDALTRQLERVSQENHALRTELAKRGMVVEFGESLGAPQFDISFPGGSVSDLVRSIKTRHPRGNIVLDADAADVKIPAFEAFGVTAGGALEIARNMLSDPLDLSVSQISLHADSSSPAIAVRASGNLRRTIQAKRSPSQPTQTTPSNVPGRAWNLRAQFHDAMDITPALAAIQVGLESFSNPAVIKYHEPTGVLIARGPDSQLRFIDDIIVAASQAGSGPPRTADDFRAMLRSVEMSLTKVQGEIKILDAQEQRILAVIQDLTAEEASQTAIAEENIALAHIRAELGLKRVEERNLRDREAELVARLEEAAASR